MNSCYRCVNLEKWVFVSFSGEPEQLLSQGIPSPSGCQREVFDENYVVWSFDRYQETSADQSAFWESILGSKEWSEDEQDLKPTVVDLPSLKEEVPFIDHSQDACEILGPVKMVHGHPIKVQTATTNVHSVTMLYRYFDVMRNGGDSVTELHSLQLLPFYTSGRFHASLIEASHHKSALIDSPLFFK
jgi:hypothetical protein